MVRPLLLAEPGPGDASCTTWTLSVVFHPPLLSGGSAFQYVRNSIGSGLTTISRRFKCSDFLRGLPVSRPSSLVSGLATISVCFWSRDLLHSVPIPQLSSLGSDLAVFLIRLQFPDLLRSIQALRPSPFLLRSQSCDWWASV
jgi:hypothetical protein